MYPNQPIQSGFGNIYDVNTSHLDKLSDRLYAEERQNKLQQQRDAKMLDDEFARNMANIRDADIPDLTKAYGDWKMANQQLMKKKGAASTEEQLDVLRRKANMYNTISGSKSFRDKEKANGADIIKNPNSYKDTAHLGMINIMKTPVSKMGDTDVFEPLRYKGNTTKFQPIIKAAMGTVRDMDAELKDNPQELRQDVTKVKRLNNAPEFYDSLIGGVVGSKGQRDFVKTFGNITPEAYELTKASYDQMMSDPVMAKRFGNPKPFGSDEDLTEVEKTGRYLAMQHALMNHPTTMQGAPIPMYKERQNLQLKNALTKMGVSDAYIKGRMRQADNYKRSFLKFKNSKDAGEQSKILNSFIDNTWEAAKDTPTSYLTYKGERFTGGRYVKLPVEIADKYTLATGDDPKNPVWIKPRSFYMTADKKKVIPVYADVDGVTKIDPQQSEPIPIQNIKADLSKLLLTKKQTGAEVVDEFTGDDDPKKTESFEMGTTEKTPAKKTVSASSVKALVGKKGYEGYTEKELMDYYKSQGYNIQ